MELTPSQIAGASFRTVRKGYDPDEVNAFLAQAADALELAQQQATSMEARARAAVARLQEMSAAASAAPAPVVPLEEPEVPDQAAAPSDHESATGLHVSADEAATISRTLVLAQRTADSTVAEATAEAERIKHDARTEAEATIDSTREMSARLLEEARGEARKVGEAERQAAANEVQSLKARREFLIGDVDQLEKFLVDQRERLRGAARQIEALVERVPAGLGQVRPPAMSASDDEPGDDTAELFLPPEAAGPFVGVQELADAIDQGETQPLPMPDLQPSDDDDSEMLDSTDGLPIRGEQTPIGGLQTSDVQLADLLSGHDETPAAGVLPTRGDKPSSD